MAAEVDFFFTLEGSLDASILVPPHAVGEDDSGKFVFVIEDAEGGIGTIRRQTVSVGQLLNGGLAILSGLKDGQLIVTAGVTKIRDGQKVRLLEKKTGSR